MRFDPVEWSAVYDAPCPSGEELAFRRGAEAALASCLERARPNEHWVDVGAGPGHLASELAAHELLVTGVDSDERMVRAAEARFGSSSNGTRLRFAAGRADELPFEDGAVDGLVATALVGLLPDAAPFLLEAHRVLRPGGSAVITFSNRSSPLHRAGAWLRLRGPRRRSRTYAAPARRYSGREAARELEWAGLRVARARYFNLFLSNGRPRRRGALIARNLLLVAVKPDAG